MQTRLPHHVFMMLALASGCDLPDPGDDPATGPAVASGSDLETQQSALTVDKDLSLGLGTEHEHAHFRNFWIPSGRPLTVEVEVRREGPNGVASDIPLLIDVRHPSAVAGQEGPRAVPSVETTAKREIDNPSNKVQRTMIIANVPASSLGCTVPWTIRVRHANAGPAPYAITGEIRVRYNTNAHPQSVEGGKVKLEKGQEYTKNFGGGHGFGQGTLVVQANWIHLIGDLQGFLPVRLKFELLRPNGTVAETATGYSANELFSQPKLRLVHRVSSHSPGQWALRLTNNTNDDTEIQEFMATMTPGCGG